MDVTYVRRSLDAAFDLVVRDQRAWSKFDLTTEGFYRSFAALLICIPLNIVIDVLLDKAAAAQKLARGKQLLDPAYGIGDAAFATASLGVQWLIFPIAMIFLLRFLDLGHRYAALVIAHNWGTVVIWLFNMPAILLYAAGVIAPDTATDINFVVLGLTLYYRFYIAQTALGTTWSIAMAIAMIDFLLQVNYLFALSQISGLWLPAS